MSTQDNPKHNRKPGLKLNFLFALVGNMGYVVFQYLTLAVIIKYYGNESVGIYHYASAFVIPLGLAFDLQLRSLYVTGKEPGHFHAYWNFRRILNPISFVLIVGGAYLFKPEYLWFILALGFLKILENQSNLIYGLYYRSESLKKVAISRWLRSGISFLTVLISTLVWKPDFLTLILLYTAAGLLVYALYDWRLAIEFSRKLPKIPLSYKSLIVLTLPMFFIALLEKYYINYPRLIIEEYFGLEAIGIIGSLFYLRMMGSQVITALSATIQGRYGEYLEKGNSKAVLSLAYKACAGGLGIGLLLMMFFALTGKWILPLLFSSEYANYIPELMWIFAGSALSFGYTFLGGAMNALRIHKLKIPVQAVAFATLIGLTYFNHTSAIRILQWVVTAEAVVFVGYVGVIRIVGRRAVG